MIYGVGIDVVEIARMERILRKWGESFVSRVFSEREAAACRERRHAARHFAARFAAKEACLKSLGLGLGGLSFREMEIVKGAAGNPELMIDRDLKPILKMQGRYAFHVSLSHEDEYAAAVVILEITD